MIPEQWYAILESNEVPRGKIVGVTRMGEKLVAWRDRQGRLSVMVDRCPHRGVALSAGSLTGDCIQCAFHGFQYDPGGACTRIPANGRASEPPRAMHVRTYPSREAHGLIFIWWGEPRDAYPPLPWFEGLDDRMVYASLRDHWKAHYARAIENQLDVVHLPFVHHNTIGRGNYTLVNGPLTREVSRWPGDHLIYLWVFNESDEGQKPKRASQLTEPPVRPFMIQFCFPNLWLNWLGSDMFVVIAFAPIDDQNTMMYIRNYHRVRIPLLRQLVGWLGNLGNLVIERQDRRVVVTQRPFRPDLDSGEVLIPGDGPIVTYRKRRRALIEAARK